MRTLVAYCAVIGWMGSVLLQNRDSALETVPSLSLLSTCFSCHYLSGEQRVQVRRCGSSGASFSSMSSVRK